MNTDEKYMQMAIDLAVDNVKNGGGPFGAVIVKDGEVIATGVNRVTANNDPTAHAEVSAIRAACSKLKTFELDGATLYTSCEPCPMCLGAIYWAHISHVFCGGTKQDAEDINFGDAFIYRELGKPYDQRQLRLQFIMHSQALEPFREWTLKDDKIEY
ncbi:MAG: nucleoside deaminase [Bacteroidaceae bacterium]|nr:nucleoside deaminase [Bacteroidaceae bacterium]